MIALLTACLLLATTGGPPPSPVPASPYAGDEAREVKALSPEEVTALSEGQGMGLARAAELNHYPGPRHVLELAAPLGLSPAQRAHVEAVHEAMHSRARELGRRILHEERALDRLFATQAIDAGALRRAVRRIARLQGALRATHLEAHLSTRAALSEEQVRRYDHLRGYGTGVHEHGR